MIKEKIVQTKEGMNSHLIIKIVAASGIVNRSNLAIAWVLGRKITMPVRLSFLESRGSEILGP